MATNPLQKKTDLGVYITRPRVTEKATDVAEANVYTFDISPKATKLEIAREIRSLYKVMPLKINVATVKNKKVMWRGKPGVKSGGRKAYVYLKKGDKIDLV